MVPILRQICETRGIGFSTYSDDWLLELKAHGKVARTLGYRFDLNNSVAGSIAQDKVATYQMLAKAGIPAMPHVLVRTKASKADRTVMDGWDQIVIKPLTGAGGHGVHLFNNVDAALGYIEQSPTSAWAATPFVDIKRELRLIMLDGALLVGYEKLPVVIKELKMFNLDLGATPKHVEISEEFVRVAAKAQSELGLRLSTVDIVEDVEGEYRILEINDSIMMEHYMRYSSENKKKAEHVYEKIVDAMMEGS